MPPESTRRHESRLVRARMSSCKTLAASLGKRDRLLLVELGQANSGRRDIASYICCATVQLHAIGLGIS